MKIGILTFHRAYNYGAVLQAFALQEFLRHEGHDVSVIDYYPDYMKERYLRHSLKHWIGRSISSTIKKIFSEPFLISGRCKRYDRFDTFINNRLRLYPYEPSSHFAEFDALIFGSDQIWQPSLTGGNYDPVFFGCGLQSRKLSYAASNRVKTLSERDASFLTKHLNNMSGVGVREFSLKNLLQPLVKSEIAVNLDPTLMAGSAWVDGMNLERPINSHYCLVYEIQRHEAVRSLAKFYSRSKGISYREILSGDVAPKGKNEINSASPEDFCAYVRFADYVFTTSFHGVALSVLQKRNFYYFRQHTNADERIESFLNRISLGDRVIEMNIMPHFNNIDYSSVGTLLEREQKDSRFFLRSALKQ